jgi:hypothetical protein
MQAFGEKRVQVVVASRLSDAVHRAEFLRLSELTAKWLARQPGFLRYELCETADGWFDTMLWTDQSSADAGNAAFAHTEIASAFARIVEPDFIKHSGRLTEL